MSIQSIFLVFLVMGLYYNQAKNIIKDDSIIQMNIIIYTKKSTFSQYFEKISFDFLSFFTVYIEVKKLLSPSMLEYVFYLLNSKIIFFPS